MRSKPLTSKPAVLFISHDASITGAPLCFGELLSSLARTELEFEPIVFLRGGGPLLQEWRDTGLHIYVFSKRNWKGPAGKAVNRLLSLFAYIRLLLRIRPLLVYSSTILNDAEIIIGWLFGARTVVHVHEGKALMRRHIVIMHISSWFTSRYICVSHYSARALRETIGAEGTVVHNGIGAIHAIPSPTSRTPGSRLVLGMVGGIQPNKGHHIAIEAIAKLEPEIRQSVCLRIFGAVEDENYRKALDVLIERLDLGHQIEFCGVVSIRDLIYASIDVLILASFDESFGRVILEAFAYSRPVVASAVGGIPEIITNGENGLLVEAGNPEELAASLSRLLQDPDFALRIARNAMVDVKQRFRLEDKVARLRVEIESMLTRD